jgi:hypothetical protein
MSSHCARVSYRRLGSIEARRLIVPMSFLRLQGRWLDRAGSEVGAGVRMQVKPGRLVLKVIEPHRERTAGRCACRASRVRSWSG